MTLPPASDGPKLTCIGKLFILLFVLVMIGGAAFFALRGQIFGGGKVKPEPGNQAANGDLKLDAPNVRIGIAYGTEKQRWLKDAAAEFAKTPDGQHITVELIPMGSLEGAEAVLKEDKRINVWCPASDFYTETFTGRYRMKNDNDPILKSEKLALTPMVFIMWEDRYNIFVSKYKSLSFVTIAQAINEPTGWAAISGKPDMAGHFKFVHTDPNASNSGLAALILMAYTYHNKAAGLTEADALDAGFLEQLRTFRRANLDLPNSTGNMVKDMVLKGYSQYDVVMAYENNAIDFLKDAEGRAGRIRIVYPKYNLWNENPYYILNVPWSSTDQRKAAEIFMNFLLSEPMQKAAIPHGFRPAVTNVPTLYEGSPFKMYQGYGLSTEIGTICKPPAPGVQETLRMSWQRIGNK